jgi:hexosaminidase
MEATIDLGVTEEIQNIKISFLEAKESWIHLPMKVLVYLRTDEKNAKPFELSRSKEDFIFEGKLNQYGRVLKIKAIPFQTIPKGNAGAGNEPWLFCSEIIVE